MKIQAAFNTQFGEPITIYAAEINDTIVIVKKSAFTITLATPDVILLTNNQLINADAYFSGKEFQEALQAYQFLTSTKKCIIQNDLMQYRIDNVIDYIGQKENGEQKFNIAELKNGHWAILSICLYYYRYINNNIKLNQALDFMNDLSNFYSGDLNNNGDNFFTTI